MNEAVICVVCASQSDLLYPQVRFQQGRAGQAREWRTSAASLTALLFPSALASKLLRVATPTLHTNCCSKHHALNPKPSQSQLNKTPTSPIRPQQTSQQNPPRNDQTKTEPTKQKFVATALTQADFPCRSPPHAAAAAPSRGSAPPDAAALTAC